MKFKGLNSGWVSPLVCVFFVQPIIHVHLQSKEIQAMQSRGCPSLSIFFLFDISHVPDKVALQQSASVEAHTHLAHSVVRYLGLTAPSELEEYGIMSAGDLVNVISRVRVQQVSHSSLLTRSVP